MTATRYPQVGEMVGTGALSTAVSVSGANPTSADPGLELAAGAETNRGASLVVGASSGGAGCPEPPCIPYAGRTTMDDAHAAIAKIFIG